MGQLIGWTRFYLTIVADVCGSAFLLSRLLLFELFGQPRSSKRKHLDIGEDAVIPAVKRRAGEAAKPLTCQLGF